MIYRFMYRFFLSFLSLVYTSLGSVAPSTKLNFIRDPVSYLFAFPMRSETLELIIRNNSVTDFNLDEPLKICFFKKANNSLFKQYLLIKKTESSFIPQFELLDKTVFSVQSSEMAQLKTYIEDNKNYAIICKSTDTPVIDSLSNVDCVFLHSTPKTFTQGLRNIISANVAIDNMSPGGYPEAGAFVSYLLFHSQTRDLDRRIKSIFLEQKIAGYGPSYDESIESLLTHTIADWHFGLIAPGKINSRVSKWPTFFIHNAADIPTIKALIDEALNQTFRLSVIDGPMKGAPGLIQIGFQSSIHGLYYEATPIPRKRTAFEAKDSEAMLHSNAIAVDIGCNTPDVETKYDKSSCDEIRLANPKEINFTALRIIMEQTTAGCFIINFSTLFPLKEDKFRNSLLIFKEKMETAFSHSSASASSSFNVPSTSLDEKE